MSTSPLHRLLLINGIALTVQGVTDLALGPWIHLSENISAGADSDARFLGGLLVGVGVFFVALSRRAALPIPAIQVLAGGMLLGVVGRLLSLAITGIAAPFTVALMGIEAVTSAIILAVSLRSRGVDDAAGERIAA